MHKLVIFTLLAAFLMLLQASQTDSELAMQTLFRAKHGLNAATHAAAQQLDAELLARGILSIDRTEAERTAMAYLRTNLELDGSNRPLPDAFLRSPVEILALDVVDASYSFPYTYVNAAYGYSVQLKRPAVVMIVRVTYPREFPVLGPVDWELKSASELVY